MSLFYLDTQRTFIFSVLYFLIVSVSVYAFLNRDSVPFLARRPNCTYFTRVIFFISIYLFSCFGVSQYLAPAPIALVIMPMLFILSNHSIFVIIRIGTLSLL